MADPDTLSSAEIESGIAWYEDMVLHGGLDAQARAILRADIATLLQMRREQVEGLARTTGGSVQDSFVRP